MVFHCNWLRKTCPLSPGIVYWVTLRQILVKRNKSRFKSPTTLFPFHDVTFCVQWCGYPDLGRLFTNSLCVITTEVVCFLSWFSHTSKLANPSTTKIRWEQKFRTVQKKTFLLENTLETWLDGIPGFVDKVYQEGKSVGVCYPTNPFVLLIVDRLLRSTAGGPIIQWVLSNLSFDDKLYVPR